MIIRRYRPGEEEAIWCVYFQATHESNARDYHRDLLNRWAPPDQDPGEWANRLRAKKPFVALSANQIVGMAEVDETGFIDYFYVHPDFQRQGVGSALLATLESEARAMNLTALVADVSVTAKDFFEVRGFEVVEARTHVIIGHPAANFGMLKRLALPTIATPGG
jgi:putative acetyltransferase